MTPEHEEAMRQQEATEAMIRMREPRGSGLTRPASEHAAFGGPSGPEGTAVVTDEELGRELIPDEPEMGAKIAAAMDPLKRATYERLVTLGDEINLWQAGVGPKPTGVILCGPKQIRRAGQ